MPEHESTAPPSERNVTVIGTGLIGCSWACLMAATGRSVTIYDLNPRADANVTAAWESMKPALIALGLATPETEAQFKIADDLATALTGSDFVFEAIPERLELKTALYRQMNAHLPQTAIVATSSSGLKLSDLQEGWQASKRLIIAHPFNPPHLIPLVELYANAATDADVLPRSRALFEACGKVTITLKREVMGHVANRFQAALWREAIHLVTSGVVSVADANAAVWAGPGLRWAIMGPHLLLNLGGGAGGLRAYCDQFSKSYAEWWADLGTPDLTPDTIETLMAGLANEIGERSSEELREERDAKLVAVLQALARAAPSAHEPASLT